MEAAIFTLYRQLLEKVNETTDQLNAKHAQYLTCEKGCDHCCGHLMTFYPVEIGHMARAIAHMKPQRREAIIDHLKDFAARKQDAPCPLLGDDGLCMAYEARPVLCRTHGLLLNIATEANGLEIKRSCQLNYTNKETSSFNREDTINQQLISTLLHRINEAFIQQTGMAPDERLSPLALPEMIEAGMKNL